MTKLKYWLTPLICAAIVTAFFTANNHWSRAIIGKTPNQQFTAGASALATWRVGPFEKITGDREQTISKREVMSRVRSIPIEKKDWSGGDDSIDKIRDSIASLLYSYSTGDYGSFLDYRLPVREGQWNDKYLTFFRSYLKTAFPEWKMDPTNFSNEDTLKYYYRHSLMIKSVNQLGDIELDKSRASRGFLVTINTNASAIRLQSRKSPPDSIDKTIITEPNVGYLRDDPLFVFSETAESIIEADGIVHCATVKLLVRTIDDPPCPQYIRLIWSQKNKTWLPIQFGLPVGGKNNRFAF